MKTNTFSGQQSDERVLLTIRQHKLAIIPQILKILLAFALIIIVSLILDALAITQSTLLASLLWLSAFVILIAGLWTILVNEKKNVTYVTDRRIIRFQASTPFIVSSRSLSWHDVVKIKTFPANVLWRGLNVGTVIAHSHSTMVNNVETKSQSVLSDDDIDIHHVYYYRDIGNYLDKILYLYRQTPKDLAALKPFVYKPKGRRD